MPRLPVQRIRIALASLATTVAGSAAADAQTSPPGDTPAQVALRVHAIGFTHQRGHAIAKLYVPGQSITGVARATRRADIVGTAATFTFPALAPGPYAIVVFHDENDNRIVDHGLFGHGVYGPTEPIGFSNGFHLTMLSYPTFDKLKFVLTPERNRIEVTVQ